MSNRNKNKKEALLLRKEELLRELKYYDKRIEDSRNNKTNSSFYDDDSSDSEEFPEFAINSGPSLTELKLQASMLKTCLHATQELTNLQILQSEVNVMVEEPVFEGELSVSEAGVWRDVTAECRVDLVPFSVSFNVHTPNRKFAPISYRNLQVMAIKSAHEKELSKSVLPGLRTPSDAVEVFLNYARAHRSRRCSLARLADKHADRLLMEPRVEGGYSLRCSRLRLVWELQNKWSPLAPFSHRLSFDLDYMDEHYIKIVSSAHRQLSDPGLKTEERTRLLTKIIDTCLQAESDMNKTNTPTEKTPERQNTEKPENSKVEAKDSELMAPPRSVPEKVKAKLKRASEGKSDVKRLKRPRSEINGGNDKSDKVVNVVDATVQSNLQAPVSKDEKSVRDKNKLKSDSKHKKIIKVNNAQTKVKNVNNTDDTQKRIAVEHIFSTKRFSGDLQSKVADKVKNVNRNTEIQTKKSLTSELKKTTENDVRSKRDKENITITKSIKNMTLKSNQNINKQTKHTSTSNKEFQSTEIKNIQKVKQNNIEKTKHLSERFQTKGVKKPVNTTQIQKTNHVHKIDVKNKKILSHISKKSDIKSKIPQKRSSADTVKKNPLRISPRKLHSTLSSTQSNSNSLKTVRTNIPKLLKKPSLKPK